MECDAVLELARSDDPELLQSLAESYLLCLDEGGGPLQIVTCDEPVAHHGLPEVVFGDARDGVDDVATAKTDAATLAAAVEMEPPRPAPDVHLPEHVGY